MVSLSINAVVICQDWGVLLVLHFCLFCKLLSTRPLKKQLLWLMSLTIWQTRIDFLSVCPRWIVRYLVTDALSSCNHMNIAGFCHRCTLLVYGRDGNFSAAERQFSEILANFYAHNYCHSNSSSSCLLMVQFWRICLTRLRDLGTWRGWGTVVCDCWDCWRCFVCGHSEMSWWCLLWIPVWQNI